MAAFAITAPAAGAAPWTGSGTASANGDGRTPTTTVVSDGTTAPAKFRYDFVESQFPDGPGFSATGSFEFKTTADGSGPVTLDWHYKGFHAFFQVRAGLTAFVHRGGSDVELETLVDAGPADCCTPPSGGFAYSGRVVLDNVQAGDTYGFRMTGSNGDSNATLEGTLAMAWVVDKTDDSSDGACATEVPSDCSLRSAILKTNASAGPDRIIFQIPEVGVQTIMPATLLPTVTDAVEIDGYTQPGASPNTLPVGNDANLLIQLNGNNAPGLDGLVVTSGGTTITGLVINGFNGDAIELRTGGNNLITGNFIGTTVAGTALQTNGSGIYMENSLNNRIGANVPAGRNVIASSANYAIRTTSACIHESCPIETGGGNIIQGNYLGTDKTGTAPIAAPPAGRGGIYLSNANNIVGGTTAGARNVMSTVGVGGIVIAESGVPSNPSDGAHDNTIQGNYIGVDATGTAAIAPGWGLTGITVLRADDNTIGGSDTAARNVIASSTGVSIFGVSGVASENLVQNNYIGTNAAGSAVLPAGGNAGSAVQLDSASGNTVANNLLSGSLSGVAILPGSANNVVRGNLMGTNAAGTAALPNNRGVSYTSTSPNTIGGTTPADRNVISGNSTEGIFISGSNATVQGNYIGLASNGTAHIGNSDNGVEISGSNNVIGGIAAGAGNVIAGNGPFFSVDGVTVLSGTGNAIRGNAIHTNANLGIDLGGNSLTLNDAGDGDSGPNNLQNFPVLTSVSNGTISGTLRSSPTTTYALDFFSNAACDASGNGEGARYLGSTSVTTDSAGDVFFTASPPLVALGEYVTATATDPAGNTSELSACVQATGNQTFTVNSNADTNDGSCNVANCTLREAIVAANATTDRDTIEFNVGGGGVQTISPGAAGLPAISKPVTINGATQPGTGGPRIELDGSGVGPTTHGLQFTTGAAGSSIRGLVINRFTYAGIAAGVDTTIVGNHIGTDPTGLIARPNAQMGIWLSGNGSTVGGTTSADRNLISGNTTGIYVSSVGSLIRGNYIGTDVTGNADLGNTADGIFFDGGNNAVVGGGATGARNVISGNNAHGVRIQAVGSNDVVGNYIGVGADGVTPLGNGQNGVQVGAGDNLAAASNNTIGGSGTNDGNVIAYNGGDGVSIRAGTQNEITRNSIHSNGPAVNTGSIGIDLMNEGVTANDLGDGDLGPNQLQNFPVVAAAAADGPELALAGTFNSAANTSYRLEFFESAACDAAGSGEGTRYVGTAPVTTDATGNAVWNASLEVSPTLGYVVTATATDPLGNTSEFSACRTIAALDAPQPGPTFTVNTAADTVPNGCTVGNCTLREAINAANAASGANEIHFDIGAGGSQTIQPTAPLPTIAEQTTIDGTTQPSYAGVPLIRIDGTLLPAGEAGLRIGGSSSILTALAITNVNGNGIALSGSGHTVQGSRIGTDATGADLGNSTGIFVEGTGHLIGGDTAAARNVISGNTGQGVYLTGAGTSSNTIRGNRIGTTVDAQAALPNQTGVMITGGAHDNAVGAPGLVQQVISGNVNGVHIQAAGTNNAVRGNRIGVALDGTTVLANDIGVVLDSGSNQVGGTIPAHRNVISGNTDAGVLLNSGGNTVAGNFIGTDASGAAPAGNGIDGIRILSGANTIGGATSAAANVISGNVSHGIEIASDGNVVRRNFIGTDLDGTSPVGNGDSGISILSSDNDIGSEDPAAGNKIAFNGSDGVTVTGSAANNRITANSIVSNGDTDNDIGIDLAGNGVSNNDPNDADGGPNNHQNFPELTSAQAGSGQTVINGIMRGGPSLLGMRIELFSSPACDTSQHGEGQTFLGLVTINDQSAADFPFTFTHNTALAAGTAITATATTESGDTSEFSACRAVTTDGAQVAPTFTVNSAADTAPNGCTQQNCTLREAILAVNGWEGPGQLSIQFNLSGATTISPTSSLPALSRGNTTIDGASQPGYDGTPVVRIDGAGAGSSDGLVLGGANMTVNALMVTRFSAHGILITGDDSAVRGSYVGTDGTVDLGNAREGIRVQSAGNTIGGTTAASRNVVSGNNGHGILLHDAGSTTVQGNYAGTDVTGTLAIPNGIDGIGVDGGSNNTIGGTAAGAGNLASGNTNQGIAIFGVDFPSTTGNTVLGNKVGTKIDGTSPLGNGGDGIRMHNAANTTVGGEAQGGQNRVAHNGGDGVLVFGTGSGNEIRRNSIVSNGDLGIDLGANGITANDAGDTDAGPNGLQNFPVLTSATKETGGVRIQGTLSGAANTGYSLDYYASASCDGSGNGEGDRWLGWSHISTNADGHLTFDTGNGLTASVNVGDAVTATATAPDGSTSEFSACRAVTEPGGAATASNISSFQATQPTSEAGAEEVLIENIPPAAVKGGTPTGTALESIALDSIALDSIALDSIALDSIALDSIALDSIGLTPAMLEAALGGVHLSDIPLSTAGGWEARLAGTRLEGVPLNSITLADVFRLPNPPTDGITLSQMDLSETALESISLGAIALGPLALESIQFDSDGANTEAENLQDWCAAMRAQGLECTDANSLSGTTLIEATLRGLALDSIALDSIALDSIDLTGTALDSIALDSIDVTGTALESIALDSIDLTGTALDSIALDSIDVAGTALESIALDSIDIAGTALESIALDSIALESIGDIVDCSDNWCDDRSKTLGDAVAADRIRDDATIADLVAALLQGSGVTLGDLIDSLPGGTGATIEDLLDALPAGVGTLGDLARSLPPGSTVGDLLALLIRGAEYDWESLPLDGTFPIQDFASPGAGLITYGAGFDVQGSGAPVPVTLEVTLPTGVRYKPNSSSLTRNESAVAIGEPTQSAGSLKLTWQLDATLGAAYQLDFQVRPGLSLGPSTADLKLVVPGLEDETAAAPPVQIQQTLEATSPAPADGVALQKDALYFGHITRGDSDYVRVPIPEYGARTIIDLSHLPADYDLVVFGPETPDLAPTALDSIPLGNEPLVDSKVPLTQHSQDLPPETLQDVALDSIGPGTTLRATSDNRGTADEHLELISLGETGSYTIRVDPYEDAESNQPYMLRVSQEDPPALPACDPRSFPNAGGGTPGAAPSLPPGVNTLFLVNKKRLGDTYGAAAADNVIAKLGQLASRADLGVTSAVVAVESDAGVAGAYAAWDANPCSPRLAHAVALEITELLDALITPAMEEQIENVVIVGGDDIIPFGRIPDESEIANERTYRQSLGPGNNQFIGSFAHGFLQTDDLYGDRDPKEWFGRQLYVPERAVGRLVEAPGTIMAQVDQFIARQGRITPTTSLVTGYDFLIDGADAVNASFAGFGAGAKTLINNTWSRQTLIDNLFPASGPQPQVNSVNAHFDHNRALPANLSAPPTNLSGDLFGTDDIPANGLDGRLVFTMGCHSGFAAANAVFGVGSVSSDFAETAAASGAVSYIANTGYGLGDTVIVAYSERLHALFASELAGSTIGKALVSAKQQYIGIAAGSVLTLYDEKVSVEATNYGLPMYRYGPDLPAEDAADPLPTITDPVTGLQAARFDEHPFGEPAVLNPVSTPNGEYFKVNGEPLGGVEVTPRRPIQPMSAIEVTQPPSVGIAHGAVLEHLVSPSDIQNFDAAWSRVEVDSAAAGPELVGEGSSSSKLQAVTSIDIPGGSLHQQLLLLAGQYRSDGVSDPDGIGIQTLYTEQRGKVYYSSSPDFTPPQFGSVDTFRVDSGSSSSIGFGVDVTDLDQNGNPGTVERVLALYRNCNGNWLKAELAKASGSNRWSGGGPVAAGCEGVSYFIQAVDAAGNVGVTSRKTGLASIVVDPVPGNTISAKCQGGSCEGWFTTDVSVELSSTGSSVEIQYSLDGAAFQNYSAAFTVAGNGVHTVDFKGSDGSEGTEVVAIDKTGPTIHITTPKDGAKYVLNSTVPADYACEDAGSGAQSCSASQPSDSSIAPGDPIDTSSVGMKTFTVTAKDAVDNQASKQVTYEVIRRPILFASFRTGFGDIYAVDPHQATPTAPIQLTTGNAIDAEPEWFPNSDRIAFSSSRTGNGDIYSMEPDGDGLNQLTSHSAIDTSPAISPNGTKIAFASNRGGNWNIWVMNADGSNPVQLTTHNSSDLLPAWNSDGTQIAFMSTRTGNGDIYTMTSTGASQTRRTTHSGIDSEPAWFNSTIAFTTNRHGDSNYEIYTMTSTGASQTRRTQQSGNDISPAWSADGTKLAFATNRSPGGGNNFNIYTMEPNGSGQTALVTHGAADLTPDW